MKKENRSLYSQKIKSNHIKSNQKSNWIILRNICKSNRKPKKISTLMRLCLRRLISSSNRRPSWCQLKLQYHHQKLKNPKRKLVIQKLMSHLLKSVLDFRNHQFGYMKPTASMVTQLKNPILKKKFPIRCSKNGLFRWDSQKTRTIWQYKWFSKFKKSLHITISNTLKFLKRAP